MGMCYPLSKWEPIWRSWYLSYCFRR